MIYVYFNGVATLVRISLPRSRGVMQCLSLLLTFEFGKIYRVDHNLNGTKCTVIRAQFYCADKSTVSVIITQYVCYIFCITMQVGHGHQSSLRKYICTRTVDGFVKLT